MVPCPKATRSFARPRCCAPRWSASSSPSSRCGAIRVAGAGRNPAPTITAVDAAGKHLLVHFADGHVLHTHMQMTGAWHVYRPAERWRRPGHSARVVVRVDDGTTAVCFAAPIVELRREGDRARPPNPRVADARPPRSRPLRIRRRSRRSAGSARGARTRHRAGNGVARPTGRGRDRQRLQVGDLLGRTHPAVHGHRRARRSGPAAHLRDRSAPAHTQPDDGAAHDVRRRARGVPPGRAALPPLRREDREPARPRRRAPLTGVHVANPTAAPPAEHDAKSNRRGRGSRASSWAAARRDASPNRWSSTRRNIPSTRSPTRSRPDLPAA